MKPIIAATALLALALTTAAVLVPEAVSPAAGGPVAGHAATGVQTASAADETAAAVAFTGRVTEAEHGTSLQGAQIHLAGTDHGALTQSDGRYHLSVPSAEVRGREVEIVAQMIGFHRASKTVRVDADTVEVDFALRSVSVTLEELETTGSADASGRLQHRIAPGNPTISATMFEARRIRDLPGAHPRPDFNTEEYDAIEENPFLAVRADPRSTFSIDVDRASYSNVRRFINEGRRPPKDAVRIEELINYFSYDYATPEGEHPFSVTTEVGPAPWRVAHRLVRIGLKGRAIDAAEMPRGNLVFLLDVSGSMRSPAKLPLLKSALRLLVNTLRPEDRVAIVVYAGAAGVALESTPGSEKERILDAIARLEAGGSTAGGAGLRRAYEVARENFVEGGNNRVILATDGDFNVGESSDAAMVRLIEEKREQGTFLTVLGFGTGNLKDAKMEKVADHGNGNYHYIDGLLEAKKVMVEEMGGTLLTIAKDVKIQVEFNPARVRAYRLIGYENRLLRDEDFDDDAKDAGEIGAGHAVTALYEVIPAGVESDVEVRVPDSLRYQQVDVRPDADASPELMFVKVRYKRPDGETSRLLERPVLDREGDAPSDDLRFASAVAAFGMILRESEHRGSATIDDVVALARGARGDDGNGYRVGFIQLAETVRDLGLIGGEGTTDG